jgi:four helix bundle protein
MAKHVEDLQCYQLADQLRREVHAICAQGRVREHGRFCNGFTEAAGSVCRNISEGFARFDSGPIVQFFTYALGSLGEVKDYLCECAEREFIDQKRFTTALDLAEHTKATTLRFMRVHEAKRKRQTKQRRPRT